MLQSKVQHEQAKKEAKAREKAARGTPEDQQTLVHLLQVKTGQDAYGRSIAQMQFRNGARYDVSALGVRVMYMREGTTIAEDPNCGGPAQIPAGQTVWLACQLHQVHGA